MKRRIVVAGGGFAGMAALSRLTGLAKDNEILLVDPKSGFDFLPMLPDALGLRLGSDSLRAPFADLAGKHGFTHKRTALTGLDLDNRLASCEGREIPYDALVVACGAVTAFYGNDQARDRAYPMRSVDDVRAILRALETDRPATVLVSGGGYTGVEAASQLWRHRRLTGVPDRIVVAELTDSILPGMEPWMQDFMRGELQKMGVEIITGTAVDTIEEDVVTLKTGERFDRSLVVWTAGVNATELAADGLERHQRGRVVVDPYLRAGEGVYFAGDIACFLREGTPLFMASYFAVQQGRRAANNIVRQLRGRPPALYKPTDFGFVIPLANGRGCGRLLGVRLEGTGAALVHHGTGFARAVSRETFRARVKDLIKEGIR